MPTATRYLHLCRAPSSQCPEKKMPGNKKTSHNASLCPRMRYTKRTHPGGLQPSKKVYQLPPSPPPPHPFRSVPSISFPSRTEHIPRLYNNAMRIPCLCLTGYQEILASQPVSHPFV